MSSDVLVCLHYKIALNLGCEPTHCVIGQGIKPLSPKSSFSSHILRRSGKSLELEQPQYFVDGRGTLQGKKGLQNFLGSGVRKMGYSTFLGKMCGALCAKNNTASSLFLPR